MGMYLKAKYLLKCKAFNLKSLSNLLPMYVEGIKGIFLQSHNVTKCYKTRVSRPFGQVVLQDHVTN